MAEMESSEGGYRTLRWITEQSEQGLFLAVADEEKQKEIAEHYKGKAVGIYDCALHPGPYFFRIIEEWAVDQPDIKTLMVVNFHLAIRDEESLKRLNFSRDMLDGMGKNLIFFVTAYGDDRLANGAYDFYSFLKLRVVFCEQEPRVVRRYKTFNHMNFIDWKDIQKDFEKELGTKCDNSEILGNTIMNFGPAFAVERAWGPGESKQEMAEANVLIRLAEMAKGLTLYAESEILLKDAKKIKEKRLGGLSHVEIAKIDYELANVYMEQGEYERAISMYKMSLQVNREVLGEEHPDVAAGYRGLAGAYKLRGDIQAALDYYVKAYRGLANSFGFDHPDTRAVYESMKAVYDEWNPQGNFELWLKNVMRPDDTGETAPG